MVTKNTANNANNALNILPEAANTAVDNDEKYLSFALVLAITIMDNLVKLIGTDGFVLYTYTLQDTATARAVFNELASVSKISIVRRRSTPPIPSPFE